MSTPMHAVAAIGISHDNIVRLASTAIVSIEANGEFVVTHGQPASPPVVIERQGPVWRLRARCGRSKSGPVAERFRALCGGAERMFNPAADDREPAQLNFLFGVRLRLRVGASTCDTIVYFAQGSNALGNNWWIGGQALARDGQDRPILVARDADGVLRGVFDLRSSGDDAFELYDRFQPSSPSDRPDWLSALGDATALATINLPGTHDSAAISQSPFNFYACHRVSLTRQMMQGVRLFDLRLAVHREGSGYRFMTCHGSVHLTGTANEFQSLSSALDEFDQFLALHPSEFLALSLKIDDWHDHQRDQAAVFDALHAQLSMHARLLAASQWPALGGVRGRALLLNRLNDQPRFGPPLAVPDNTDGALLPAAPPARAFAVYVQDRYRDLRGNDPAAEKLALFMAATQRAPGDALLLNFASATLGIGIAKLELMPQLLARLGESDAAQRSRRLGWALFDFEHNRYRTDRYGAIDIVQMLIDANFGYALYPQPFRVLGPAY